MNITTPTTTNATPAYASISAFCGMTGIRRSKLYELLGTGDLHAVKAGRSTLIDVQHGLGYMRALPPAVVRPAHRRRRTA